MFVKSHRGRRVVRLPGGGVLSLADLPPTDERFWTAGRKARVVEAVIHGLLSRGDVLRRYDLSPDELAIWETAYRASGAAALRVRAGRSARAGQADAGQTGTGRTGTGKSGTRDRETDVCQTDVCQTGVCDTGVCDTGRRKMDLRETAISRTPVRPGSAGAGD